MNKWKIEEYDKQISGENWLICNCGYDGETNKEYAVVTDGVRASQLDHMTAKEIAQLIAATPELLRAAKEILLYLDSIPNWEDEPNTYAENLREVINKI